MCVWVYLRLRVNSPPFHSSMKLEFLQQILEIYSNVRLSVQRDPISSMRTDRHDEANCRFSQYCELAYKPSSHIVVDKKWHIVYIFSYNYAFSVVLTFAENFSAVTYFICFHKIFSLVGCWHNKGEFVRVSTITSSLFNNNQKDAAMLNKQRRVESFKASVFPLCTVVFPS
jgi:hypothetical protein